MLLSKRVGCVCVCVCVSLQMELARNVCGKKPVLQGMLWDTVSADAKDLIT